MMDTLTTTMTPIMTQRKKWYAVCNNYLLRHLIHHHTRMHWLYHSLPLKETYIVSPSYPHLSIEDFRKQAVAIFKEYFEHGDTADVAVSCFFIALLLERL